MSLESMLVAVVNTNNDRLNFEFVNPSHKILKVHREHDDTRLDFNIPRTEEATKKGHAVDLPISFFQIKEGDVISGKRWYLSRFPKLNEDLAEIMARYNWGDLKYATKKSLRNNRKKSIKRTGKKQQIMMEIKRGPTIVTF